MLTTAIVEYLLTYEMTSISRDNLLFLSNLSMFYVFFYGSLNQRFAVSATLAD